MERAKQLHLPIEINVLCCLLSLIKLLFHARKDAEVYANKFTKITISSIVIGLKKFLFPTNSLACCRTVCYRKAFYRTVFYQTVQQTNQPITFKVVV